VCFREQPPRGNLVGGLDLFELEFDCLGEGGESFEGPADLHGRVAVCLLGVLRGVTADRIALLVRSQGFVSQPRRVRGPLGFGGSEQGLCLPEMGLLRVADHLGRFGHQNVQSNLLLLFAIYLGKRFVCLLAYGIRKHLSPIPLIDCG
jgi:hypothetical protein